MFINQWLFLLQRGSLNVTHQRGSRASPKNIPVCLTLLTSLACVPSAHSLSGGWVQSVCRAQRLPQGQPCRDIIYPQLCTVVVYLMTAAPFPCGMLVPILYISLVCTVVCAILVSFCLHCGRVVNVYTQSRLLLGWLCSLLSQ